MKRRVLRVLLVLLAMGLCTSIIPQTIYAKAVNNERVQQVEQQGMVKASKAGIQKNHGEGENNSGSFNRIKRNTANPERDFVFNAANAEITQYKGTSTNVVVPETIGGIPVTRIGETAFNFGRYGKKLNSIVLPSGLKSIGENAFGQQKFTNIVLPEGLESIEEMAFLSCENLKEIILPDSLTSMGRAAFKQCFGLSKVELSAGLKVLPNEAFSSGPGKGSLETVSFKNGLEEIGSDAFYRQKLRTVILPDSVKIIKRQAFGGQQDPDMHGNIYIGKSIQEIHAQAGNIGNISNAFVGWKGGIIFSITKDEATARGVNAILTYPGASYKVYYASTVKYETNGGEPVIEPEIVLFENSIKNKPADPSRKGYNFAGWYKDVQFTAQWDFNDTVTSDMTLYAKWDPIVYKVHFDANTGTGTMDDMNFIINDNLTLTANKYTKEGYTFKEWNTKADGTGTPYADGKVLQNMPMGSLTLYAQWERNQYTISYEFASVKNPDGISAPKDITAEFGTKVDEPKFTAPENWTFDGWYTDKKCTQKFDFNSQITGNITLFGKWTYTAPENTKPEASTKPSEPTKPSGPSKPAVPEAKPSDSPMTDDTSSLGLTLLFLMVSFGLMLSVAVKRKK